MKAVEAGQNKIRVLLVDDHPIVSAGLRTLLEQEADITVVGIAGDGLEAVALSGSLRPDVVVLDLAMPRMNGLEALQRISEKYPDVQVLVLTMHNRPQYLKKVLRSGGAGFVLKSGADEDLIVAIRTVYRGNTFLYPDAVQTILRHSDNELLESEETLEKLSPREKQVFKLTALGYSSREIAEQLYLSPKTVDTYRQRVMEKLNLHHRAELVRFALKVGLISP